MIIFMKIFLRHEYSHYKVKAGISYLSDKGFMHEVEKIIVHHNYAAAEFNTDIALVKV